jgi:hypothetical protein
MTTLAALIEEARVEAANSWRNAHVEKAWYDRVYPTEQAAIAAAKASSFPRYHVWESVNGWQADRVIARGNGLFSY